MEEQPPRTLPRGAGMRRLSAWGSASDMNPQLMLAARIASNQRTGMPIKAPLSEPPASDAHESRRVASEDRVPFSPAQPWHSVDQSVHVVRAHVEGIVGPDDHL